MKKISKSLINWLVLSAVLICYPCPFLPLVSALLEEPVPRWFCSKNLPTQRSSWSPAVAWGERQLPRNNSSQRPICAAVERFPFILQLWPQTFTWSSSPSSFFTPSSWNECLFHLVVWYQAAKHIKGQNLCVAAGVSHNRWVKGMLQHC